MSGPDIAIFKSQIDQTVPAYLPLIHSSLAEKGQNETKLHSCDTSVTGAQQESLFSLIFSVNVSKDICNFDFTVHCIQGKTNKLATNLLSASMLWRYPFVRVYLLWKSGPYMSKVCYGHGRWPLVAGSMEGRGCCIGSFQAVGNKLIFRGNQTPPTLQALFARCPGVTFVVLGVRIC